MGGIANINGIDVIRNQVLCGILKLLLSCFCLQVLEYEGTYESGTWTKIGELEIKRNNPAIAEANLAAFDCDIIAGSGGGSPHLHTQIVQQPSLVFCWLLALVAWL